MFAKSIFASRTFWVNVMSLAVVIIDYLLGANWLPPEALGVLATVNIGLRAVTSTAVTLR